MSALLAPLATAFFMAVLAGCVAAFAQTNREMTR